MLMGEDAIQLSSLYVFGLEVIRDSVWLVYGPTTQIMFSGWCDILALNRQRDIPLEEGISCMRIV